MAGTAKSVNTNLPVGICMVSGCGRTALYRNARTRSHGVMRGYCEKHKAFAVSKEKAEPIIDGLLRRMEAL